MASEGKHKVLVIGKLPPQLREALGSGYDLVERDGLEGPATGFHVAVTTSMDGASEATISAIPELRLIACNGAGTDAIDLAAAEKRGITVCNTPNAVTQDTAEFAIALILTLGRRVIEADRFVRDGKWGPQRMTAGHRIAGRTVGLVGLGRIGKTVAAHACALGMKVRYTAQSAKPELPYIFEADVRQLAANSDILVVSVAGGADTHHMIDAKVLAQLGSQGLLVNVARGSVVDETALIEALQSGVIAGAALDVFANEPTLNSAFAELNNVILTPHYAAATEETRQAMAEHLRRSIDAFFQAA